MFVSQPVDINLICGICFSVMEKPSIVCREGHAFCDNCVTSWSISCATCREPTIAERLFNRPLHNIIMNLHVQCPEKMELKAEIEETGPWTHSCNQASLTDEAPESAICCEWTGPLSNLEIHRAKHCRLRMVECPLECGKMLRACNLDDHKQDKCKYRIVRCRACGTRM
jgi:hypothetical protein